MAEYLNTADLEDEKLNKIILMQQSSERSKSAVATSNRIIGLPFQYLDTTDIRPYNDIRAGRLFLENMIAEAPILSVIPVLVIILMH